MALRITKEQWIELMTQAGVENESIDAYADILINEQLAEEDVIDLGRAGLSEIGMTKAGHSLKLIRFLKARIRPTHTSQHTDVKRKAPDPPAKVTLDMSKSKFQKFITDWKMYKQQCEITLHTNIQLYKLCEESIQTIILNTHPKFQDKTEDQLLDIIKNIATEQANPRVHRSHFNKIVQQPGETMKHYAARLQNAAADCEFKCRSCKKNIPEQFIEDQFINGMYNAHIQTELFAKDPEIDNFSGIFTLAERLEGASRDQSRITSPDETIAKISDYRKMKKRPSEQLHNTCNNYNQKRNDKTCTGCGKAPHKGGRKKECPAWNVQCTKCLKNNHFGHVCRSTQHNSSQVHAILPSNASDTFCTHGCDCSQNANTVANVSNYQTAGKNDNNDEYETISYLYYAGSTQASDQGKPQEIEATLTPQFKGRKGMSFQMMIFPDTGASLNIAGPEHQKRMRILDAQLSPCSKQVKVAGGTAMVCYGWCNTLFNIEGNEVSLPLYFCKSIKRLYFGKAGCIATKLISPNFPKPMPKREPNLHQVHSLTADNTANTPSPTSSKPLPPLPARPKTLPFSPTPQNIPLLKQQLIKQFKNTAFCKTARGHFPQMTGPPMQIHLKKDAVPKATYKYIPVPRNLTKAAKRSLDRDTALDIIEPLPLGEEAEWCSQMLVVPKKQDPKKMYVNEEDIPIRRTIDFQYLNSQCKREPHVIPSPFALASQVPANQYKTVMDAVDGYHSVPLTKESWKYTNFVTQWGIYRCKRAPQGFFSSGDGYSKRYDYIIKDVPRCFKIVDDSLLHDSTIEEAYWHTWDYLMLCAKNGIVINLSKFQFCQKTVNFAGLKLTTSGVAPSDQMLSAIKEFPAPKNITGARSWFGLVNQVSWAHTITDEMQPFRDLIKKNSKFHWTPALQSVFEKTKQVIIEAVKNGIQSYDPQLPTCIQCDWSKTGIGYLLMQKHCKCELDNAPICCPGGWKIAFAGSRFTNDAESNYSATEGEALAVAWSLNHARMFTLGSSNLLVVTDHKPLLGIMQDRNLASITNRRIQRFKEKTLAFHFNIQYCPGRLHKGADAVSRYPAASIAFITEYENDSTVEEEMFENAAKTDAICALYAIHDTVPSNFKGVVSMKVLETACKTDKAHQLLLKAITQGFPATRHTTDTSIRDFWSVRHRLSCNESIIFLDQRLVIPAQIRSAILRILHSAHQGCSSMSRRAKHCIYWPSMDRDILNLRADCGTCWNNAPSNSKEPLLLSEAPKYPYEQVAADYFYIKGHAYLTIVDCFSGWLHVFHFPTAATYNTLINICRDIFVNFGTPTIFASDGGPQFIAHTFSKFLKDWDIHHRKSSAGYAQSNGRAELAVKTAKSRWFPKQQQGGKSFIAV